MLARCRVKTFKSSPDGRECVGEGIEILTQDGFDLDPVRLDSLFVGFYLYLNTAPRQPSGKHCRRRRDQPRSKGFVGAEGAADNLRKNQRALMRSPRQSSG